MIRHIVAWNYKDGFTEIQNKENAKKIKAMLESLTEQIEGIIEIEVTIDLLPTSNRDLFLNSLFENEDALAAYQTHPEHLKASAFIGTVVQNRACIDYYEA